jgi:hypothetical protein
MLKFMLLILMTLSASGAGLAGRYVLHGVPEVASELLLNEDGTFEYIFIYGAADFQAKGTWKTAAGGVVLNTATDGAPPLRMLRSAPGKADELRVWVKAPNGVGIQQVEVSLDTAEGEVADRTQHDGSAVFPYIKSARTVQIRIPVYNYESAALPLNAAHREFHFEINGDAITRVPFKDEPLTAANGALEMRFWNKERPMQYRRR